MDVLIPQTPFQIVLYCAGFLALLIFVLFRPRRRKGMRLRLGGAGGERRALEGVQPPVASDSAAPKTDLTDRFSRIRPASERPLNVMFNYNGHSWDAYEVLGLPAGSSLEKAHEAYTAAAAKADATSRGFLEAAFSAIYSQWEGFRKAGES